MNFVKFDSARDIEKARQDLKQVREHMLVEAKSKAEEKAEWEAKRFLKGETNWMLPSVGEKLKKKNKKIKQSKRKKDKKRSKKSNKKSHRKKKQSTSEDESKSSDSDCTDDSSDSSPSNNKETIHVEKHDLIRKPEEPLKRDSWMTDALMLKTYSREREEKNPNDNEKINTYDPLKSARELNPYWKKTGTGLPAFQKPKDEDDSTNTKSVYSNSSTGSKSWRKQTSIKESEKYVPPQEKILRKPGDDASSSSDGDSEKLTHKKEDISTSEYLTDQQMNELGAKIIKAEIMGNMGLVDELRVKLEKARAQRNLVKERKKSEFTEYKQHKSDGGKSVNNKDQYILLTHTDQAGHSRPLPTAKALDGKDLYGGKKKQKRVNCHDETGKRVRYFADDDRYDIKQMFEREKYTSSSDVNLQFANVAGKHKNTNDDLEDIFAVELCQNDSMRSDHKDRNKAIREHKKIETVLDNCDKCFDSKKKQNELMVCVGENVYLALPWYQGLQSGHCMIIPNQHASCCTQLDEDTWTEVNEFRNALTRMFAVQHKDVIFFEIANKLHRRPHLVIHCIPVRKSDGEMAPFYFKKAIEESEHEWCVNKQLVSLHNKSLRNSIPKGLPYFWVNFGMDTGFAHVIEDEERFPANFAQEIIAGMLNLDASKWRRLQKEHNIITKVKIFADWWKKYDCTT